MTVEQGSPEQEHLHHTYVGNEIPWYVRGLWILFWIFVIYYSTKYFLPAIQNDLLLK